MEEGSGRGVKMKRSESGRENEKREREANWMEDIGRLVFVVRLKDFERSKSCAIKTINGQPAKIETNMNFFLIGHLHH